ncbi:FAH family protein [Pelagibius litoralis]|uniref:FAH family protein n=1 Tax=Pelagibius litoralis TaxID=374515 RepID=A0A967C2N4_9PROT|nr:AraD1 family protein [Pelagibius litoralis]NIA68498.1 FAH family protein [Pelagibius litoralis]
MRLVQFISRQGQRAVAIADDAGVQLRLLDGVGRVYDLAQKAAESGEGLAALAESLAGDAREDYEAVVAERRLLSPVDHPDDAHCLITGTGLTHLGSADARDSMHKKVAAGGEAALSDSMKMFKWGIDGGKPSGGGIGVPPEWFFKGDGGIVAAPEQPLAMVDFAEDGGDEVELVGLYLIDPKGQPRRLGFALGNEFSDHVIEQQNYLYLAHSKLRPCSFGPELLLGAAPDDIRGTARVRRGGEVIWEKPFGTGEANMSHSIANLEHHHFKYPQHRRPGDVHVHYFGAATLSFSDGIRAEAGDIFEIESPPFGRPLRNPLALTDSGSAAVVPL